MFYTAYQQLNTPHCAYYSIIYCTASNAHSFHGLQKKMHQKDQLSSDIFKFHITVVQSLLLKLGSCLLFCSLCCWPVGCNVLLLIQLCITYEFFINGWHHYKPHLSHCQVIKWVWQPQLRCCQQNISLYAYSNIYFMARKNLGQWEMKYLRWNHTLFGFCVLFHVYNKNENMKFHKIALPVGPNWVGIPLFLLRTGTNLVPEKLYFNFYFEKGLIDLFEYDMVPRGL